MRIGSLLPAAMFTFLCGCGANVVFAGDGNQGGSNGVGASNDGAGGSGASTSIGGSGVGGSVSTGTNCDALLASFSTLFSQATTCNTCQDFDPCINGTVIQDQCGCPAGTSDPNLAVQASEAYQAWVSAGCGPFQCDTPCIAGGTWFCTPNGGTDCMGTCSVGFEG